MKSITIHNLDNHLASSIEARAKKDGISLNKEIKRLLALAIGLSERSTARATEFKRFCGHWDDKQADSFDRAVKEFKQINPADWE